jgi:hypothetical protein
MDMQNLPSIETSGKLQIAHQSGIEVVRSAGVSRRYFSGPRPGRGPSPAPELSKHDRIVILRGQLTMLRKQLEAGLQISIGSVARAERLACSLEAGDAA